MDIIVGVLAAWGFIMLLWTLFGVLLLPLRRRDDTIMTIVLRGSARNRHMERYLQALLWLRNSGVLWWDIIIVPDGLDMDTLERLDMMMYKESHIEMVALSQLYDWMEGTYEHSCKRTDPDSGDGGSGPL